MRNMAKFLLPEEEEAKLNPRMLPQVQWALAHMRLHSAACGLHNLPPCTNNAALLSAALPEERK